MTLFSIAAYRKRVFVGTVVFTVAAAIGTTAILYATHDFTPEISAIERAKTKEALLERQLRERNMYIRKNADILVKYMRYRVDIEKAKPVVAKGFDAINQLGYVDIRLDSITENEKFYNCADVTANVQSRYTFLETPLSELVAGEFSQILFDVVEGVDASVPGQLRFTIRKKIR